MSGLANSPISDDFCNRKSQGFLDKGNTRAERRNLQVVSFLLCYNADRAFLSNLLLICYQLRDDSVRVLLRMKFFYIVFHMATELEIAVKFFALSNAGALLADVLYLRTTFSRS